MTLSDPLLAPQSHPEEKQDHPSLLDVAEEDFMKADDVLDALSGFLRGFYKADIVMDKLKVERERCLERAACFLAEAEQEEVWEHG
jgi:hypothetical protein